MLFSIRINVHASPGSREFAMIFDFLPIIYFRRLLFHLTSRTIITRFKLAERFYGSIDIASPCIPPRFISKNSCFYPSNDLLGEYKYRETKETEHNASIFARKEEREEKKRREIRTSCGSNSRYEITILTRVLQCEILRARNSGPRVSRGTR